MPLALAAIGVAAVLAGTDTAAAGTGGTEFNDIWVNITDWVEGTLGKVVAMSMILVGIFMGIARQNLMTFAVGLGAGLGLNYAPTVVDSIMTATIKQAEGITPIAIQVGNGLL
ncbi:conjugal transfer protein TraA [Roseibium sp. RKSG952]|nr:conjugal transfer protein TraA [Roseibium sp. RKSG952]